MTGEECIPNAKPIAIRYNRPTPVTQKERERGYWALKDRINMIIQEPERVK